MRVKRWDRCAPRMLRQSGFPGREFQIRAALSNVLGDEKVCSSELPSSELRCSLTLWRRPISSLTRSASLNSGTYSWLIAKLQFLEFFFAEEDAKFFASLGLNCIRIAFNYRHFEDDMNPRVLKPSGFKHLDRVIDICAKHGLYTILDLHTAPGGQNCDW